jgi:hypothetical protein
LDNNQREDLSSLIFFLDESEGFICYILENRDEFILKYFIIDQRFWSTLESAWQEVRKNFEQVRQALKTSPLEFTDKLREHGLTDDQLKFKMELFKRLIEQFYTTKAPIWLRRLLNLVNSMLGSLTAIFPPLGSVKEFKEALEQIIKTKKNEVYKKATGSKPGGVRIIRFSKDRDNP